MVSRLVELKLIKLFKVACSLLLVAGSLVKSEASYLLFLHFIDSCK